MAQSSDQRTAAKLEDLIVSLAHPTYPQISPDGGRVAYFAEPYGQGGEHPQASIWIAPLDGPAPAFQLTRGEWRDDSPRWAPDGRSLAFLSDRAERGTKGLYRIPVDGGEAILLVKRKKKGIETFKWSPDGTRIAFTAPDELTEEDERREKDRDDANVYGERWPYAWLHVLDLASGDSKTLPTGDVHVVELAWSPDGAMIAYLAAATPEQEERERMRLFVISPDGGEPREICRPRGRAEGLAWASDSQTLLYVGTHEADPQSSYTIFATRVADDYRHPATGAETLVDPRIVGPGVSDSWCAVGLRHVPGVRRVVIAVAEGLTPRLEWLDPVTGAREILYAFPEGDIGQFAVGMRDVAPVIAAVQSTGSAPPEVFVGRPGSLRLVSDHHAALAQCTFGTQEPFFWTAPDGLALDGLLIRPPGMSAGPLPTVVLVHGGPYGRWSNGFHFHPHDWGQWLAVHGYAVLLPNCRGGMGHGHEFAASVRGDVGGADYRDIMAAVDAVIARGVANPERLGIGGWSQGGFMTAWAVTQTKRFKAGVMGAGVADWRMMVLTSDLPTFEASLGGSRPWDGPGPHRGDQLSPISFAKNARTPLLILHGQNDARVPVSQAIGFQRALRNQGIPVELVTYPREPHGIREQQHQRDLLRRVLAWFDRWLKEDKPSTPGRETHGRRTSVA
ncbi:MAG: S9 family peptidase [bacterium]